MARWCWPDGDEDDLLRHRRAARRSVDAHPGGRQRADLLGSDRDAAAAGARRRARKRHGLSRRLTWRFAAARGRQVMLIDSGTHAWRLLADTKRRRGHLTFTPLASGAPGRRTIKAIVLQDGLPKSTAAVARYTAGPAPRLRRVAEARILRHGTTLVITWTRVPHASASNSGCP